MTVTAPPEPHSLFMLVMGITFGLLYSWLWVEEKRNSAPGTSNWTVTKELCLDILAHMAPGGTRKRR